MFHLKYEFHTMALALIFNWEVPLFHPKYESKYDSWSYHLWKKVDSEVDWGLLGLVRKKRVEGLEILISIRIMMKNILIMLINILIMLIIILIMLINILIMFIIILIMLISIPIMLINILIILISILIMLISILIMLINILIMLIIIFIMISTFSSWLVIIIKSSWLRGTFPKLYSSWWSKQSRLTKQDVDALWLSTHY